VLEQPTPPVSGYLAHSGHADERAGLPRTVTPPIRILSANCGAHGRAGRLRPTDRPPARPPAAAAGPPARPGRRRGRATGAAWPPARRLCPEWRKRLPGQERTGTPANDVEDYRIVVD